MFLLLMNQRQQRVDRLAQAAVIIERMAILWSIAGGARQLGVNFTGVFAAAVFQALALFGLGAAGADPRLVAAQRNSGLLAQKIVQRTAVEALPRRPKGEVRKVVVD